jgi:tetratricopeptide (TPR) repeat protein
LKVEVFSRLGDSNVDSEDWWRAVLNYRQALVYWRRAHGSQTQLSSISAGLTVAYFGLGQRQKAIETGTQCLQAALAAVPKSMMDVSVAYNNLGFVYRSTRQLSEAQRCYEQALQTAPKETWEGRARAATIESNLGELYALTNQTSKALKAYRHALSVIKTEMPRNTQLIKELTERIRALELHRAVALARWPISVTFIKAEI